jgi:hypothetical protein
VHWFDGREGGTFRVSLTYDGADRIRKTTGGTDTYQGRFVKLVTDEQIVEALAFETDDPMMKGRDHDHPRRRRRRSPGCSRRTVARRGRSGQRGRLADGAG